MAVSPTTFDRTSNNINLVREKWGRTDFQQSYEANQLSKYMAAQGKSLYGKMPISVFRELTAGSGDRVTVPFVGLLTGDGQTDDGDYDGNSEALSFKSDIVTVHERGHETTLNGYYTEFINYHGRKGLRDVSYSQLAKWMGMVNYSDMICALSGVESKTISAGWLTGVSSGIDTVNVGTTSENYLNNKSTSNPRWVGISGNTSTGAVSLVANDAAVPAYAAGTAQFSTGVISYVKRMAQRQAVGSTVIPPITPVMIDGNPHYIMLISQAQREALRLDPNWVDAMNNSMLRGKNPLVTGADGIWEGVIIHTLERLHSRVGAGGTSADEYFDYTSDPLASGVSGSRAIFLGANALSFVLGEHPIFSEGYLDSVAKSKHGVHTRMIYGVKAPSFKILSAASDNFYYPYGLITVDTPVDGNLL